MHDVSDVNTGNASHQPGTTRWTRDIRDKTGNDMSNARHMWRKERKTLAPRHPEMIRHMRGVFDASIGDGMSLAATFTDSSDATTGNDTLYARYPYCDDRKLHNWCKTSVFRWPETICETRDIFDATALNDMWWIGRKQHTRHVTTCWCDDLTWYARRVTWATRLAESHHTPAGMSRCSRDFGDTKENAILVKWHPWYNGERHISCVTSVSRETETIR